MKRLLLAVVSILCLCAGSLADGNNYGSSVYLSQGVGARALGLGGAFTGLADDATAGFWNPAGLSQMELYDYYVGSEYAMLSNQLSSAYLSYSFRWPDVGNCSISWINFSSGDLEKRDVDGNVNGQFTSSENAFILSYGCKVYQWVKGLSVGANLKITQQSLDDFSAVGHGLDLGALWQPIMYLDHTVGIEVQNLLGQLYWNNSDRTIDRTLVNVRLGIALKYFRSNETLYFDHWINTVDLEFSEQGRFTPHVGTEYWFLECLGARAGYDGQGITFGASYRPEYYEIDYSFHYGLSGDLPDYQNRISIQMRFQ